MARTTSYVVVVSLLLLAALIWVMRTGGDNHPAVLEPGARQSGHITATPATEGETPAVAGARESLPIGWRAEANILAAITRQPLPDVISPPWADDMEAAILNHVAQYPGLELTELQVQCAEQECVIFLGGRSVPVYQMGFDVFADDHGFANAIIRSMDGGPNRLVYLRR